MNRRNAGLSLLHMTCHTWGGGPQGGGAPPSLALHQMEEKIVKCRVIPDNGLHEILIQFPFHISI